MEYRDFGCTGLNPSLIGMGCNRISSLSNNERDVGELLHAALDGGINFFDTADRYGHGESEHLLGEAFKGRRDDVILCTKAGYTLGAMQQIPERFLYSLRKIARTVAPVRKALRAVRQRSGGENFSSDYLRQSLEGSLRRLGTDHVDIFLLHSPGVEVVSSGTLGDTLAALKDRGLTSHYGVSCPDRITAEYLRAAITLPGLSVIQIPVHPYTSRLFDEVAPSLKQRGIGVIGRAPFDGGRLFADERFMGIVANGSQRSASHTALRFAIQLIEEGIVLPGISSREHLADTLAAVASPLLSDEEICQLRMLAN